MPDEQNPLANPAPNDPQALGVASVPKPVVEELPGTAPQQTSSPQANPTVTVPPGGDQTFATAAPAGTDPTALPPMITPPTPPPKTGISRKFVATMLGILLLVGAVGAGILLVQQQQEIREEAAVGGINSKLVVDNQDGSLCYNKCLGQGAPSYLQGCRIRVVHYKCDGINPGGCQENGALIDTINIPGDGSAIGSTSYSFDISKQCGTQQIDAGCSNASGSLGNVDFQSYIGPEACGGTPPGPPPPPGPCPHCETVQTCAEKGGTWNGEGSGGCSGAGFGNCNLPPQFCQPVPPPPGPPPPPPPPPPSPNVKCNNKRAFEDEATNTPGNYAFTRQIANGSTVTLNQVIVYQIAASNTGNAAQNNVTVRDTLSASLEFMDAESDCTFDAATRKINCSIGNLGKNKTVRKAYRAKVITTGSPIANKAVVLTPNGNKQCNTITLNSTTPNGQCIAVDVFDTSWNEITDLTTLKAGNTIRLVVQGSATSGNIDKARFTVNGTLRPEVTQLRDGTTGEFYDEYKIPDDATGLTVKGEVHHSVLDAWF